MGGFVGREAELTALSSLIKQVQTGGRTGRPGKALLVRGRRRVGKSRLIEEFLERNDLPHMYFTAIGGSRTDDLAGFAAEITTSSLANAAQTVGFATPTTWDAAFSLLATALPRDTVSVIVLDEMPYLVQEDPAFEGALQKAFDRTLSKLPVLLILVGSDLAMMEKLNTYGRPFYQRGTEMIVSSLNPADVAAMLGLSPANAFDAYLVTGGLPLVLEEWPPGTNLWGYLALALHSPTSALLVSGERALMAEFPTETQARAVLGAIGSGERTFTMVGRAAGGLNSGSLTRSLDTLIAKRVVAAETPLSVKPSRETRYRIDDPYLRFWLSFIGPSISSVERGRGDQVLERIKLSWTSWRGRAIEPVLRDALWRLAEDYLPLGTDAIGSYWTRTNDPEVDIIGADRAPIAKRITTVGSIKWLENSPFDYRDLARLLTHRTQIPGADETTVLMALTRSGSSIDGITILGPDELLTAWN